MRFLKNFRTDILKDKPSRAVFVLSMPIIMLNLLRAGNNIVDMFWLGHLGKDFLSGVSASIFLVWAVHGLSNLTRVGIVSGISRNVGNSDLIKARVNSARAIKLSLFLGVIFTFVFFPLIHPLIRLIGISGTVYRAGAEYLEIMVAGNAVSYLIVALHAVMIAWGDTVTPVKVYFYIFIFNIVLSPLMIFGVGPFPRLETRGAAFATIISFSIGTIYFFLKIMQKKWVLFRKQTSSPIPYMKYISVGYPVALTSVFFSLIYYFIAKITAMFGSEPLGAMGIGHKLESVAYFFAMGLGAGLSTFVGQNLGAGKRKRAWQGTVAAMKFSGYAVAIYSCIMIIFAPQIMRIFNDDPQLVEIGVKYLRIVFSAEILQSLLIVLEQGAFTGAGFTKPSFYFSFPLVLARIPLAWFFSVTLEMESTGVWLTIFITMVLNSIVFIVIFFQKKWLKAQPYKN